MSETKEIPLTEGRVAIVDAKNYDMLMKHKWHLLQTGDEKIVYAATYIMGANAKRQRITMQNLLMNTPSGMVTHHIDQKKGTLDNTEGNLVVLTPQQHSWVHALDTGKAVNVSGYCGVYPTGKKWCSKINRNGKLHHCGTFEDAKDAAIARDLVALELGYPRQGLNFQELADIVRN
jgi:hypothetical protein